MKLLKRVFKYIEPLWLGVKGKISIRSFLAICFSIHLMINISHAVRKWDSNKSMEGLAMVLTVEAGLIAGLLALRTYSFTKQDQKADNDIKDI